jgi:hypothetical protein
MLNKKNIQLIIGCLLVPFFISCSNSEQPIEECSSTKVSAINPNGDSELALLMRQMYVDADSLKQTIINDQGTISNEFINELEKVHNAIPTDENVKTPEFGAFNKSLVHQAKALQTSSVNKTDAFNQLINRCLDCHNSFCPGPIKKIKKLKIPTH